MAACAQGAREAGDFTIASHGFSGWWIKGLAATGDRRSGTSAGYEIRLGGTLYIILIDSIHCIGHNNNH